MTDEDCDLLIAQFVKSKKAFSGFLSNVTNFFLEDNEALVDDQGRLVVHSIKSRIKAADHLREKLKRKAERGEVIDSTNIFAKITDLCGARIMHLRRSDFAVIHKAIAEHVANQHWYFAEEPKAYTWDPEYKAYFDVLGIHNEIKESFYTSVHYLVRPNPESSVICELQVRSLFEEIWGEVDHELNYPNPTDSKACSEQLKVLAKLVGAGTRLVDSIYSSVEAHRELRGI